MPQNKVLSFIREVIAIAPKQWLELTTHRLDIYREDRAKEEFLTRFEQLFVNDELSKQGLLDLPTAYDYIRLGHPLSSVLEWFIAKVKQSKSENVIAFGSQTMSIMSVLRKNAADGSKTRLIIDEHLEIGFDVETIKKVYEYDFEIIYQDGSMTDFPSFQGKTIFVTDASVMEAKVLSNVDFTVHLYGALGSILLINGTLNDDYIADVQHVRRRETVAMTPDDTFTLVQSLVNDSTTAETELKNDFKKEVCQYIKDISGIATTPLVGTSGLSIQYAIMMGLIDYSKQHHPDQDIKFIVPTNCYGGTNDQARRVADRVHNVAVVDLHVDGENDMVSGLRHILEDIAKHNAVPYIIAEIPTNPRVEVPDLNALEEVLLKTRKTAAGHSAVAPVFILDQTFCPNIQFMVEGNVLARAKSIAYASGSKFPSGGKCTAGYCYTNNNANHLTDKISTHLDLCDNEATTLQYRLLSQQLPSMNERIVSAYKNTRAFVNFISEILPTSKINFVSEELAARGFTPSVFSLDLPTKGSTPEERDAYKRDLNLHLIRLMIGEIPEESKYCVSYGQLKGCYWTIPATSTQGTTKEKDKDYIVRASLSPQLDLEKHKEVFQEFVNQYID